MDDRDDARHYSADSIDVTYDVRRCIHAGECLRTLPAVFNTSRRPWILPTAATAAEIVAAVERCPSGALHYTRKDGGAQESGDSPATIRPMRNGPLVVRGHVEIHARDGTVSVDETRMTLCRCGASANKPFCDNTHRKIGFKDGSDITNDIASANTTGENIHEEPRA